MRKQEHNNTDALLDSLLHKLPDKPVASNFTARVLQAVAREQAVVGRSRPVWLELLRHPLRLLPRVAMAGLALFLGLSSYRFYENGAQAKMARSVVAVSQVASLPGPDVLQDFEAVRHLSLTPPPDQELLALLQ
jgi:hypothetical protein